MKGNRKQNKKVEPKETVVKKREPTETMAMKGPKATEGDKYDDLLDTFILDPESESEPESPEPEVLKEFPKPELPFQELPDGREWKVPTAYDMLNAAWQLQQ